MYISTFGNFHMPTYGFGISQMPPITRHHVRNSLSPKAMQFVRHTLVVLCIGWALFSAPATATPPLSDHLEFENETTNMWTAAGAWLSVPHSDKLQEMRRAERCSAKGGPKPSWRVADGKLWLVRFHRCSGEVPLEAIYDQITSPVFADWVTADLLTNRGPFLCLSGPYGPTVYATTVTLKIDHGIVKDIKRVSNADHPRVPKERKGDRAPPCLRVNS